MIMGRLNRFNKISPYYDKLVKIVFGNAIERAQLDLLSNVRNEDSILVLGGGSGWWLNYLTKTNPGCSIDFVEASDRMIELASMRAKGHRQIQFVHGTELNIPEKKYDVIILFFFLDMFDAVGITTLLRNLQKHARENARLLVVEFVHEAFWHKILLVMMYSFFRLIGAIDNRKLAPWQQIIFESGISEKNAKLYYGDFIKGCVYTM